MQYSFSQIQTYLTCPRKYQYQYIDKIKAQQDATSINLILGSSVHDTLEKVYTQRQSFQSPSPEAVLGWYDSIWQSYIRDTDNIYISPDEQMDDYYQRGVAYITTYMTDYFPHHNEQMLANESFVSFPITDNDTFRGKVDRIDLIGSTCIIHDYKTNKSLPLDNKHREQLTLYAIAVKNMYSRFVETISCKLHYLHFNTIDSWTVSLPEQETIIEKYRSYIQHINHDRFRYNMGKTDSFAPQESYTCNYCPYKSICPLRSHQTESDTTIGGEDIGESTVHTLIDQYAMYAQQEKEAKEQKEMIKPYLLQYAQKNNHQKLYGTKATLSISQMKTYSIDDQLPAAAQAKKLGLYDDLISIDRYKVAQAIKDHTTHLEDRQGHIIEKISPTIRVRYNKEKTEKK